MAERPDRDELAALFARLHAEDEPPAAPSPDLLPTEAKATKWWTDGKLAALFFGAMFVLLVLPTFLSGGHAHKAPVTRPPGTGRTFISYPGNGGGPTQCADGRWSHSSGPGTCSGHGGEATSWTP